MRWLMRLSSSCIEGSSSSSWGRAGHLPWPMFISWRFSLDPTLARRTALLDRTVRSLRAFSLHGTRSGGGSLNLAVGKNGGHSGLWLNHSPLVLAVHPLYLWRFDIRVGLQRRSTPCKFQVFWLAHIDLMSLAVVSVWNLPKLKMMEKE